MQIPAPPGGRGPRMYKMSLGAADGAIPPPSAMPEAMMMADEIQVSAESPAEQSLAVASPVPTVLFGDLAPVGYGERNHGTERQQSVRQ